MFTSSEHLGHKIVFAKVMLSGQELLYSGDLQNLQPPLLLCLFLNIVSFGQHLLFPASYRNMAGREVNLSLYPTLYTEDVITIGREFAQSLNQCSMSNATR